MVTVGFIVEGHTEATLIKHDSFIRFLADLNLFCNPDLIINAKGKYNIYHPHGKLGQVKADMDGFILRLRDLKAERIFILLDFDGSDPCYTQFKSKVYEEADTAVIVAKQAVEAWFLADTQTLCKYLNKDIGQIELPESFLVPFDEIRRLRLLHSGNKGVSDKKALARNILSSGFSLTRAAAHPSCPSAAYFLHKLQMAGKLAQS